MEGGKSNKWLTHVKKTLKAHKGKSFKAVLKMAKKTYKGGADVAPYGEVGTGNELATKGVLQDSAPVGGRRRKSRKASKKSTRRTRKH
jgi:hypothetical protein